MTPMPNEPDYMQQAVSDALIIAVAGELDFTQTSLNRVVELVRRNSLPVADVERNLDALDEERERREESIRRDERAKVEAELRKRLLREIRALTPHEVPCDCAARGSADLKQHADECPRGSVRLMLAALDNTPTPEEGERSWGTTKDGVAFHCQGLGGMSDESRAALETIVDHAASLSPEELESYAKARRSIVDARSAPEEGER